jgi:nitrate reductase NapE component
MLHEFFQFASENPFLTFFLFAIVSSAIVGMFKYLAYAIKGDPNIIANGDDDE